LKTNIFILFIAVIFITGCEDDSSRIGDKYFNNGDYQKAVEAYSEYLSLKPNNIKALYNRGRAYEELGMYDQALVDFNKVLVNDINNLPAQLSIVKDLYRRKAYEDAIYKCDLILETDPRNAQAFLLQGQSYQKMGKIKEAMKSYNTSISTNTDFGEAYLYRGILRIYLKQRSSACNDFKIAQSLKVSAASKALEDYCK